MADYIPNADRQFKDWLNNFIEVANVNLAMLGLSTTEITSLKGEKDQLDNGITACETATAAAQAATEKKNPKAYETIIDELNLPSRVINALLRENIETVADLVERGKEDLTNLKGVGKKSIDLIVDELKKMDVDLK